MGGSIANPTYQQVCTKATGHAETAEVVYDTKVLSTLALLTEFFTLHDFTTDRNENGGQYRSVIFLYSDGQYAMEQEEVALVMIAKLRTNGLSVATILREDAVFYTAGNRHQKCGLSEGVVPKRRGVEEILKILTF
jgi:peptide methionine sulfoxide reductase MsrA